MQTVTKLLTLHQKGLRDRSSSFHLSASAMVFDAGSGIFIRHPYLHTILLPAGHVEPNEMPIGCAIREFTEETGLVLKTVPHHLIDVNIIDIPANPKKGEGAHQHLDFRYWFSSIEPETNYQSELPVFRLTMREAPAEFQPYFALMPLN